ncbi:MAG: GxxExxY protein [Candidatus Brocadiia bacterium]
MGKSEILFPELSYEVMQAAFEVHNTLGPGFIEEFYEQALVYELEGRAIPFERQKTIVVSYKGRPIGQHRLDLVVGGKIILELKAVAALADAFKQQVLSYLKATGLNLGMLINFGTARVEYVRIVN